jgi:hypothetical protein
MKALAVVGLIACLASLPALADCVEPQDSPRLPDGITASREDMIEAMKVMKAYDSAVREFTECVQKTNGNRLKADRAVDRLTATADKFNAALRVFKQRNGA